jgi:hypothetical protein
LFSRRDRIVRAYLRYRLVVTTHDDATWDGLLMDADDQTLVLRDVQAVQKDGTRVPADGEVLIPRSDVAYVQHVPAMQRP